MCYWGGSQWLPFLWHLQKGDVLHSSHFVAILVPFAVANEVSGVIHHPFAIGNGGAILVAFAKG
jgi:hypothetical protein